VAPGGAFDAGSDAMPTYEYICRQCKKRFDVVLTLSEHAKRPKQPCPKCKSRKVEQLVSAFQAVTSKKA
jgi:putative FmdB family regulatory protein